MARWLPLIGWAWAAAAQDLVPLDLFVASKCPDAARCETAFLPEVLKQVGSIVDLRMGFIAEVNASAPWGYNCMHGDTECEGNLLQLCVQAYFPKSHDVDGLGKHSWFAFLECVNKDQRSIPSNTDACLSSLGVPPTVIEHMHICAEGDEGQALLAASVEHTHAMCGYHGQGCVSCEMFLSGSEVCVEDGGRWYNCSMGHDTDSWVDAICAAYEGPLRPSVCSLPNPDDRPRVVGHSYFSSDPDASASFAVRYLGAQMIYREAPKECEGPLRVDVALPRFDDWRGGGLQLSFVRNPLKFAGNSYDAAAHIKAMETLYGNLSDNTGHQWVQYFDNHLGLYVEDSSVLATHLEQDGVPFFTTMDSGWYQSIYIQLPGTGAVVEVLGDFVTEPPLRPSHVRIESTQQFCTPYRRRHLADHADERFETLHASSRPYPPDPSADMNKTTWAAADPQAAIDFAVKYLGASEIHQRRGVVADGQCALLRWALWPDGHEWHLVDTLQADWITKDNMRPDVPYNVSDLAEYIERSVRDVKGGRYDQFMDHAEVMEVEDLDPLVKLLSSDGVPFLVRGLPSEGRCAVWVNVPKNAITVQIIGRRFESIRSECEEMPWDLCSRI